MSSNDAGGSNDLYDASPAMPGWLFALPWSLKHTGGVNEVVKSLIHCFRGGVFSPVLIITSEGVEPETTPGFELTKPLSMDLWGPCDERHPVRALLSFLIRLPLRCFKLRRIVKHFNIKVINPHFPDVGALTFLILKTCGQFDGEIILSFHRGDVRLALSSRGFERSVWKSLLRGVDHIVVVSDDLGRDVLALEPKAAAKVTTIYNGVNLALFASAERDRESALGASREQIIISVGAFIPRKGHDVLVRAFSRVTSKVSGARLLLLGGRGPELERIREIVDSLSLADRVEIYNDVPHEQVPAYLSRASLFALASRDEGYPLAVIEAGAVGLPVVCTRAAGLPELIVDGVTGRIVEVDDEAALAEAMIDLLTHCEEATRIARNFREYVRNTMTWEHAYHRYLEIVGAPSP